MMKWSRFFRTVGFLIVLLAALLALIWYGKQLDGHMLWLAAMVVFAISIAGLFLALLIPAVKRRWWRRSMDDELVRRRLGAFFYVFWGVPLLSSATYAAISLREIELERDLSAYLTELNWLFRAMSTVSLTLIFACLFLMIRLSRSIHDEAPGADGDR